MFDVESIGLGITLAVVSAIGSGALARRRGYPAAPYGGLGIFLSLGALPLTMIATARAVRPDVPRPGPGFTPVDPPPLATAVAGSPEAAADLAAWRDLHRSIQQGLCLGFVLLIAGFLATLAWVCDAILPTFVTLFEGMSLKLPAPTLALISFTKFFRGPGGVSIRWVAQLICPSLVYLLLVRAGYAFPILGRIWRHTDRLWHLHAVQATGDDWIGEVPAEVANRLGQSPNQGLPPLGVAFEPEIRRERDRLASTLWMLVPLFAFVVGLVALAINIFGLVIFLPLYQLIGTVG